MCMYLCVCIISIHLHARLCGCACAYCLLLKGNTKLLIIHANNSLRNSSEFIITAFGLVVDIITCIFNDCPNLLCINLLCKGRILHVWTFLMDL